MYNWAVGDLWTAKQIGTRERPCRGVGRPGGKLIGYMNWRKKPRRKRNLKEGVSEIARTRNGKELQATRERKE